MKPASMTWRVGLFVSIGLVLLAGMALLFSKGISFWQPTYGLILKTANVSGIKPRAGVLLAGIPVGMVVSADLAPDGKSVYVHVRIHRRYVIRKDAVFTIEQAGFLGDQYIAVIPQSHEAPPLQEGAVVTCQEPFNLQEAARSAVELIQGADRAVNTLDTAVRRIDRALLSESTLTNIAASLTNLPVLIDRATSVAVSLDHLVASNQVHVSSTLSNLALFSQRLSLLALEFQEMLETNRGDVQHTLEHFASAGNRIDALLAQLQEGRGLAGSLLQDPSIQSQFSLLVSNLTEVSANLKNHGLLYKPRAPRAARPSTPIYSGRKP